MKKNSKEKQKHNRNKREKKKRKEQWEKTKIEIQRGRDRERTKKIYCKNYIRILIINDFSRWKYYWYKFSFFKKFKTSKNCEIDFRIKFYKNICDKKNCKKLCSMYARTIICLIDFIHALSRNTHIFNLKERKRIETKSSFENQSKDI